MIHRDGKIYYQAGDDFRTPTKFFDYYNRIFGFTLDVAASDENHKCERYYTVNDDGLSHSWGGEKVWCNPPYGRETGKWMKKCYEESLKPGTLVVALVPSRTDTKWFHEYCKDKAICIFIKGRLNFNDRKEKATFGSLLCIWGLNYETLNCLREHA